MKISYDAFAAVLGAPALNVWRVLVWFRDETQAVFPGVSFLAAKAQLSPRTTQRALARLRLLGLLEDIGTVAELTERGFATPYHRLVKGSAHGKVFSIPKAAMRAFRRAGPAGSHGGRRAGAGRPRASTIQVAQPVPEVPVASRIQVARGLVPVELPRFAPLQPASAGLANSRGALMPTPTATRSTVIPFGDYYGSVLSHVPVGFPVFSETTMGPGKAGVMAAIRRSDGVAPREGSGNRPSGLAERGGGGGVGPTRPPTANDAGRGLLDAVEELRRELLAQPRRLQRWGEGGLPPFPSTEETHVRVPGPPRLPEGLTDAEALAWCGEWYYAALRSREVTCPRIRMAGRTKAYFEDALEVWREKEIRPAAWIAWRVDSIIVKMPRNARRRWMPSFPQILSTKALTEQRWQYRQVESQYTAAQLRPSRAGAALMGKLNELWVYAHRASAAQIRMAVDSAFPEGYAKARRAVIEKTEAERQGVLDRVKAFEWIWPTPRGI